MLLLPYYIRIVNYKIKLLNEYGYVMNLNGFEVSFLLILEQINGKEEPKETETEEPSKA